MNRFNTNAQISWKPTMATATEEGLANSTTITTRYDDGGLSQSEVPRDVLEHAQIFILDKDRTPATMSALINSLKLYVSKNHSQSINKVAWIRDSAAASFIDVQDETSVWDIVEKRRAEYTLHRYSRQWMQSLIYQYDNSFGSWLLLCSSFSHLYRVYLRKKLLYSKLANILLLVWWFWHLGVHTRVMKNFSQFVASHYKLQRMFRKKAPVIEPACDPLLLNEWWPNTGMSNRVYHGIPVKSVPDLKSVEPIPMATSTNDTFVVEKQDVNYQVEKVLYLNPESLKIDSNIYDQYVVNTVTTVIGTDQCHCYSTPVLYVDPNFTDKDVIYYDKIESNKLYKDLPNVELLHSGNKDKIGHFYHIGPAWLDVLPAAFASTQANEKASLCGRHLAIQHTDDVGLWDQVIVDTLPYFIKSVNNAVVVTLDQWLSDQPGHKRHNFERFLNNGVNLDMMDKRYHFRNFFIKDEVLVPSYEGNISNKFPRGIQGLVHPPANMLLGPFMTMVSKALASDFGGIISYSSGRLPHEIGDWYHQKKSDGFSFYEDDFSQYDSTQGLGCHKAEMAFYNLFHPTNDVLETLNFQKTTVGFGKFHKYKTKYTRKSGDQNTSIGNSVINAMAHLWANNMYCKTTGRNVVVSLLVLGDDNLLAVKGEGPDYSDFMQTCISRLGLIPKFIKCGLVPTYCSSVFLPVRNANGNITHVLVPEVCKRFSKMGWTVTLPDCPSYLRIKGNCQSALNNSLMPVGRIFDHYYLEQKGDGKALYEFKCHGKHSGEFYVCEATFVWFEQAYGLTRPEVFQLEEYINECCVKSHNRPFLWQHPLASKMYDHYSRRS
jgi:hypothetical protein